MKPLIGVSCNYDFRDDVGRVSDQGMEGQDWNFLAGDYTRAVEKAGGIPVILPQWDDMARVEELLERLDGLILSGGNDIHPNCYGQPLTGNCGFLMPMRDEQDIALARMAMEKKIPTLGICRGLQAMAVAFGGVLYQDIEKETGLGAHELFKMPRNGIAHPAVFPQGSPLREIYGKEQVSVNSLHHQAVAKIPENGKLAASSPDGLTEAVAFSGGHPFYIGVQWHPEMMYDSPQQAKLFQAFVKACEKE